MRPGILVLLLLLLLLVQPSIPLRCLECEECGARAETPGGARLLGRPTLCREGHSMCMKLETRGRVHRSCSTREACGYGAQPNWPRRLWRRISGLIGNHTPVADAPDLEARGPSLWCCGSDFCNSARVLQVSWLLLMAALAALCH